MAETRARYAQEHLTFDATTLELVAWAAKPTFAPDVGFKPGSRSRARSPAAPASQAAPKAK